MTNYKFFSQKQTKLLKSEPTRGTPKSEETQVILTIKETRERKDTNEINMIFYKILKIMEDWRETEKSKEENRNADSDWILVAMVIDRVMLVIFIFTTIILNLVMLNYYPEYSNIDTDLPM